MVESSRSVFIVSIACLLLQVASADDSKDLVIPTTLTCRTDGFAASLRQDNLSKLDSWIFLIGCPISLIIQIGFIMLTIRTPKLRQQPGDILVGASIAETILSSHWLMQGIHRISSGDSEVIDASSKFCVSNSVLSIMGTTLSFTYNFLFFLVIGMTMNDSLSGKQVSRKNSHILAILLCASITLYSFSVGNNGVSLYGTCSMNPTKRTQLITLLLFTLFLTFSIWVFFHFRRKIPNTTFYAKNREEFLSFSLTYLSAYLLTWGFVAACQTVLFLNCEYLNRDYLIEIFSTLGNATKIIASFSLTLLRLKDPYIQAILRSQEKYNNLRIRPHLEQNRLTTESFSISQSNSFDASDQKIMKGGQTELNKSEITLDSNNLRFPLNLGDSSNNKAIDLSDSNNIEQRNKVKEQKKQRLKKENLELKQRMVQNEQYFEQPFYNQSTIRRDTDASSVKNIDKYFGKTNTMKSTGNGSISGTEYLQQSSSFDDDSILQAESLSNDNADHFVRVLQRNIRMGVLCRILCGIQLQFKRKNQYCSKLDITLETLKEVKQRTTHQTSIASASTDSSLNQDMLSSPPINSNAIPPRCHSSMLNFSLNSNNLPQLREQRSNSEFNATKKPPVSQQFQKQSTRNFEMTTLNKETLSTTVGLVNSSKGKNNFFGRILHSRTNNALARQMNQISLLPFSEVKVYSFSDDTIKSNLPYAPSHLLDSDTFDLVHMRVYAPLVFHSLLCDDMSIEPQLGNSIGGQQSKQQADFQTIFASLDLQANIKQIKNASGSDGGKSGQFFFFSSDNRFLLKTVTQYELTVLLARLPQYFKYLKANPRSCIAKIFGVYSFERLSANPIHLILMKNIAGCEKTSIIRTFDLKGSTFDREVLKKVPMHKANLKKLILKDLDFLNLDQFLDIEIARKPALFEQLTKDAKFLESCGLIDYSLIVFKVAKSENEDRIVHQRSASQQSQILLQRSYYKFESTSNRNVVYHIGIIDYLQMYTLNKVFEKYAKKILHCSPSLDTSSQDPQTYSKRFISFLKQILSIS